MLWIQHLFARAVPFSEDQARLKKTSRQVLTISLEELSESDVTVRLGEETTLQKFVENWKKVRNQMMFNASFCA
jgi:hypothetical protein